MQKLYTIFTENIIWLNENQCWYLEPPQLIQELHKSFNDFENYINKNLVFTNKQLNFTDQEKFLHSNRDATREAIRLERILSNEKKKNLVLLSAGLGYSLILDNFHLLASLLIIEYNPVYLIGLLANISFASFKNTEVKILFSAKLNNNDLESVFSFFQAKSIDDFFIHAHPGAIAIDPTTMNELTVRFNRMLEKRSINQATIIKFQDLWNRNILINSKIIFQSGKFSTLQKALSNKYENIIIAGAGPSLVESCTTLLKHKEKYMLIAVDTAYLPLIKQNIIPDIVLASDPQWINHHFVLSNKVSQSVWILDPVVQYNISHFLQRNNAPIYFWDNPFALDELLRSIQGDRGEIQHGGSVSTNAFDLALKLAPKNILLVGQDLSFYNKMAHTKGAMLESMIYHNNDRFHTMENHNHKQFSALPKISVNSIPSAKGKSASKHLFTNAKLQVFLEWFSTQSVEIRKTGIINLYNASFGGARIPGIIECNLDHFFSKQSSIAHSIQTYLNHKEILAVTANEYLEKLKSYKRNFIKIRDLLKENILICKSSMQKIDPHRIKKLDDNDLALKTFPLENKIISLGAQKDIILLSEQSIEHKPMLHSLKLYTALHLSTLKVLSKL